MKFQWLIKKLLYYINGRLNQIKRTDKDTTLFGNVSIIAVGDFYQLPPVKGSALYKESVGFDLFNDVFSITQLDEIMRQKGDAEFAQLLNRLRMKRKGDNLLQNDFDTLLSCEVKSDDSEALHIYTRNIDVDKYNEFKFKNTCKNSLIITAQDRLEKTDCKRQNTKLHSSKHSFNCLPDKLCIGIDGRVIMTMNVDTSDGLVNGAFGKVTHTVLLPILIMNFH